MAAIAIDIGASSVKLALVDAGAVLREQHIPHSCAADGLEQLAGAILPWLEAGGVRPDAMGIAVPGIVRNSVMVCAHDKVAHLWGRDLSGWSESTFGLPAVVENDARAACWGEFVHGAGRGVADLAVLTVGTGVGMTVIAGGRPLHGAPGHGGILGGHMRSRTHGRPCNCGGRGCIEAKASGGAPAISNLCQIADPAGVVLTGGLMTGARDFLAELQRQVRALGWDPAFAPRTCRGPERLGIRHTRRCPPCRTVNIPAREIHPMIPTETKRASNYNLAPSVRVPGADATVWRGAAAMAELLSAGRRSVPNGRTRPAGSGTLCATIKASVRGTETEARDT